MLKEFQKFIMRGNVIDLAVGIIIGTAFTAIVNSLVNDIVMPPVGWLVGGVDFSEVAIQLPVSGEDGTPVLIGIGLFINALINFLIVALAVFLLVRAVNNLMDRFNRGEVEEEAAPEPSTEEQLLEAIKELTAAVKNQN